MPERGLAITPLTYCVVLREERREDLSTNHYSFTELWQDAYVKQKALLNTARSRSLCPRERTNSHEFYNRLESGTLRHGKGTEFHGDKPSALHMVTIYLPQTIVSSN